jgi:hypothetical protein
MLILQEMRRRNGLNILITIFNTRKKAGLAKTCTKEVAKLNLFNFISFNLQRRKKTYEKKAKN